MGYIHRPNIITPRRKRTGRETSEAFPSGRAYTLQNRYSIPTPTRCCTCPPQFTAPSKIPSMMVSEGKNYKNRRNNKTRQSGQRRRRKRKNKKDARKMNAHRSGDTQDGAHEESKCGERGNGQLRGGISGRHTCYPRSSAALLQTHQANSIASGGSTDCVSPDRPCRLPTPSAACFLGSAKIKWEHHHSRRPTLQKGGALTARK